MTLTNRYYRISILLVLLLLPVLGWATEMSTMWSNLYREAESLDQQFVIMDRLTQESDRDLIPILIQAQADLLLSSMDPLSTKERYYHNNLQKMIVRELGELKAAEAGDVLFRTISETRDNFLKAEAIASLGKIGAVEYAEPVAFMLRNLNLGVTILPSKEETETVITACITALERMKDSVGFEPVFFTAVGRYTRKVMDPAERALYNMVDDPSPLLGDILIAADDFSVKLRALEFSYTSRADNAGKAHVAAIGLSEGLKHTPENIRQMTALGRLRTSAAGMLGEFGYEDSVIVAGLVRMLDLARTETRDMNEVLICLQALGAGRGEEPVRALSAHLEKLNNLQQDGITITDQREITQVIRSLGATGNPLARGELTRVEFSNWNSTVNREARAALEKLN